jgi:hypothetical protein
VKKIFIILGSIVIFHNLYKYSIIAGPQALNHEPNQPSYLKPIPPEKLKEDLDFLFKTIEEVHPNMYAYTSKEEFAPLREQLYISIDRPMNRLEFYKLTAPVVASLKNGHTFVELPFMDFQEHIKKGGKIFSLGLNWDEEKVILSYYNGPLDLPIGAEVLTIDNHNAEEFLTKTARFFPAEGKTYNLAVPQRKGWLPMFLWLEKGNVESLTLQIKTNDEQAKKYDIKVLDYNELKNFKKKESKNNESKTESTSKPENQWYSYRYIQEYDTGLIEFNMFENMQQFKRFLKQTFTKIRNQNVSNLIIDIRKNPGGSNTLGYELLKYLTAKRFRQNEEVQTKISHQLFRSHPHLQEQYGNVAIGSTVTEKVGFRKAGRNRLRFKGRVFVLIGPASASSSVDFASAIKHFRIGTLVGQETGDTIVNYGNCIPGELTNSGLRFHVASKYFIGAGGKPDGRGVIPDYEIKQKPQDTAKGVDTVLQFTLNLTKKSEPK